MIVLVLGVLGLGLGSFVNALAWRLHEQELAEETPKSRPKKSKPSQLSAKDLSIVSGRSMCPDCHHELAPQDLVPVVSWLWLRGKCRYCSKPISWQYPLVELATATLFIVSYLWWPLGFSSEGVFAFALWLVFLTGFMALAVYDIRWFLLPDRIVYPLIVLALGYVAVRVVVFGGAWPLLLTAGWGVLLTAGLFYLIFVVSRGAWIGFGDVKLAVVLGILVGGPLNAALLLFAASLLGSVVALPLVMKGKAKGTTHLPFGPFLLSATVIIMLFGADIANWYDRLLLG